MPVIEHINVNGVTYDIGGGTDNGNGKIFYGTCSGGSSVPVAVSCSDFTADDLTQGAIFVVYFSEDVDVVDGITLSVNGTAQKSIIYNYSTNDSYNSRGSYVPFIEQYSTHVFVYDGYNFVCIDRVIPSGDTVSFTQTRTSGDEIGKITINGINTTLYANLNTDTKVTQSSTTTSSNFPILIKSTTTSGSTTNVVYHSNKVLMNPSIGVIAITTPTASNTSTSAGGYRIYNGADNNANITGALFNAVNGTASTVGITKLQLGNSTASGAVNNASGQIAMYANTAFSATIMPITTLAGNRTFILPQTDDSANKMLVASVTSGTGSGVTPTYVNANGQVVACSYPLLPYTEVTSW